MTSGTLQKWYVKEGSEIKSGDSIAEIETDKATLDFECLDEGIVAKLIVQEGTKDIEVISHQHGCPLSAIDIAYRSALLLRYL